MNVNSGNNRAGIDGFDCVSSFWTFSDGALVALTEGQAVRREAGHPLVQHHYGIILQVHPDDPWRSTVAHAVKGGTVEKITLAGFSEGKRMELINTPSSAEHQRLIVDRAKDAIRAGALYHPVSANCEHFVEYCYTGKASSGTVRAYIVLGFTLMAIAIVE